MEQYLVKYESIFKKHKKEIDTWADKTIAKLHSMSDNELLLYFPGTGAGDLKIFRQGDEEGSQEKKEPQPKC